MGILLLSRRRRQTLQAGLGEEVWLKETLVEGDYWVLLVLGAKVLFGIVFVKKTRPT